MTNQISSQRMIGRSSRTGGRQPETMVLLGAGILLVLLVALGILSRMPATVKNNPNGANLSSLPQDGRATYTEPYWQAVAKHEAASTNPGALPQDGRAYFTESYWNPGQTK